MKTSARPREVGGSYSSRTRHGSQLSISDNNHHVTEAIGDMYGDEDYGNGSAKQDSSRPLSFVASPLGEQVEVTSYFDSSVSSPTNPRSPTSPLANGHHNPQKSHTLPPSMPSQRSPFDNGPLSPTLSLREHAQAEIANQQFPLSDIDYQSDPADIQQEMHNLQALRRMSMDVGNSFSDPDLPSFQGVSLMPSVAPTGDDNEEDPSRLFWVPARVHPELAPMEFKTFLENRVQTIKRRSGEQSSLSADGPERAGSTGGLQRKKSMLSRQIDNSGGRGAVGYKDGAEQLERKKSLSSILSPEIKISDLQELDALVRDPSNAMKKLTLDTNMRDSGIEVGGGHDDDKPILPTAPGAMGLKRSTHTTYRRGSLRRGERIPFSQRAKARTGEIDVDDATSPSSPIGNPLSRVSSDPAQRSAPENFSRPGRRRGLQHQSPVTSPTTSSFPEGITDSDASSVRSAPVELNTSRDHDQQPSINPPPSRVDMPVPRIVETPPPVEEPSFTIQPHIVRSQSFPERSSSQTPQPAHPASSIPEAPPARSSRRPQLNRETSSAQGIPKAIQPSSVTDMSQSPTPLVGNNSRTDSLTFIPTLTEQPKPDKKSKKDDGDGPRKTSWGWFKGSKDDDSKESKKAKKGGLGEKNDNTRLDILQHSIDTASSRGRESLVLDRDSIDNKLHEERKKDSSRKSGDKKEKDGLFSSLFGGGKKKSADISGKKATSLRATSPDPPHRVMRPDIDYSWTRFSLLEERAIYRMAHIKLANPRRALYSQVLLSNFMYSYLAKVQQMHPHVQVPISAQQKKQQEAERRQKEIEAQKAAELQYKYDYHSGIADYADADNDDEQDQTSPGYGSDSQHHNYDHQNDGQRKGYEQANSQGHGSQSAQSKQSDPGYYSYGAQRSSKDDDNDMW